MHKIKFNLQLFADGAAIEGGGAEGSAQTVLNDGSASENPNKENAQIEEHGAKKSTETVTTSDTLEARKNEFEKLISGEYKELFSEKVQSIFNKRFRDYKTLQETNEKNKPIIDMMMQKYGVKDVDGLMTAVENDQQYWEEAAEREGMTVEQYKEFSRLRTENEQFRNFQENLTAQNEANRQMQEWLMEGEELKKTYPQFNFRTEIENRDFVGLLKAGIPLKHAYEVLHKDDIIDNAVSNAVRQTEKKVVSNIQANGVRPSENGIKSPNGFVLKKDVSSLSKSDRAELARRAQRGENISF